MLRRSPWTVIAVAVAGLVSVGVTLVGWSSAGDVSRDIGIAMTSGGITGLVFIIAEAVLAQHDELERLLLQLSLSPDLNRRESERASDLTDSVLAHANLEDVNLTDARMLRTNLRKASLVGSDLRNAVLELVDLRGANLSLVQLDGALLRGIAYDSETMWPSGFTPPPSDPLALEAQAKQPDWDYYWSDHRRRRGGA